MFIGGETTPPTPTTDTDIPMSANNNISDLSAALETITGAFSTAMVAMEELQKEVLQIQQQKQQQVSAAPVTDELAPFHAWLQVELTPYFGNKGAKMISDKLNRSRAIGDFRYFIPVYQELVKGDLQKRQLLKAISAVYRYKFGGYKNPEQYSLRSEIKYAAACPECGHLAKTMMDRLIAEGLWK
jgi:hypothetical protein